MLPQPINSSECHALHVMYVLFVYAVGFLFWAAEANMLNNFYRSNSVKLKRHWQQWKLENYRPVCIWPFGWTLQCRLSKLLPGQRKRKESRRRSQRPESPTRTRGGLNINKFSVWIIDENKKNSSTFL